MNGKLNSEAFSSLSRWESRRSVSRRRKRVRGLGTKSPDQNWSGLRGSNPSNWLGKPEHYHYAKPAQTVRVKADTTTAQQP
jgi:hypothetical protein